MGEDYLVKDNPHPDLAPGTLRDGIVDGIPKLFGLPVPRSHVCIIPRHCGFIDLANINHYIANGDYSGLVKALQMRTKEVIEDVKRSGLRGKGGAGFPTGQKWEFCRRAPSETPYFATSRQRAVAPLVNAMGKNPALLVSTVCILGSPKRQYGDASVMTDAFARVPITFVLWKGDEEVSANGNILFDANISGYLYAEDITVLT